MVTSSSHLLYKNTVLNVNIGGQHFTILQLMTLPKPGSQASTLLTETHTHTHTHTYALSGDAHISNLDAGLCYWGIFPSNNTLIG